MPMRAACKIRALTSVAVALAVAGCVARAPRSSPPAAQTQAPHAPVATSGQAYQICGSESLLIVHVYRGGTLARAGHNHLVASHALTGTVFVAQDLALSSFELAVPVGELTVDEAQLRAAQGADFAADVPESAKEGTRHNMLGAAVLDADHYPQVTLRSQRIEVDGSRLNVQVEVHIRDQLRSISVPVNYTLGPSELLAEGALPLKQSDLGLSPFTALLGALAVQDEMQLQFHLVARVQK